MEIKELVIIVHTKSHVEPVLDFLNNTNVRYKLFSPYLKSSLTNKKRFTLFNSDGNLLLTLIFALHKKSFISTQLYLRFFDFFATKYLKKLYKLNSNPKIVYSYALGALKIFKLNKEVYNGINILDRACPSIDYQMDILINNYRKRGIDLSYNVNNIGRMIIEYSEADYIFVPSKYTLTSFNSPFQNKLKVIELFGKFNSSQNISCLNCDYSFLSIGGNFVRKGFPELIDVFSIEPLNKYSLVIKSSAFLNDSNKAENIQLITGRLSEEELLKLYLSSDIFILNSIDEGFGMVVLEAMYLKRLVIVSKSVGSGELIDSGLNGFVYSNIEELCEIIQNLKNYDLEAIRNNGFNTAKKYSHEYYGQRWLNQIKEIENV